MTEEGSRQLASFEDDFQRRMDGVGRYSGIAAVVMVQDGAVDAVVIHAAAVASEASHAVPKQLTAVSLYLQFCPWFD